MKKAGILFLTLALIANVAKSEFVCQVTDNRTKKTTLHKGLSGDDGCSIIHLNQFASKDDYSGERAYALHCYEPPSSNQTTSTPVMEISIFHGYDSDGAEMTSELEVKNSTSAELEVITKNKAGKSIKLGHVKCENK